MCFHYSLKNKKRKRQLKAKDLFAQQETSFESVYHANGFNNPMMPVITNVDSDKLQMFSWGLIPGWTKSMDEAEKIRKMTLNAKSETIYEKPSFRNAIKSKRCLIPATGFFEWQTVNNKKYPYYISLKDEDVFMFAGIWDSWTDKQSGEIINTFSIITTTANLLLQKIHNVKQRMPVILEPEKEYLWLENSLKPDNITSLLLPYNTNEMTAYTIGKQISSTHVNTNNEDILKPFSYPELIDNRLF